jgi:hypothetical protein
LLYGDYVSARTGRLVYTAITTSTFSSRQALEDAITDVGGYGAQYFISPAGLIYAGVMVKTANAGDFIGAPDASTHNGHTSMYVSGSANSIDVYEWNGTRRSTQFSVNTLTGSANEYVLGDYSYTSAAEYTATTSATRSAGEQYFVYSFNFAAMNAET